MEDRKIGNCGVKETEGKESSGCDEEKTEKKTGEGFVRGSKECLFQWSQTVQMAS